MPVWVHADIKAKAGHTVQIQKKKYIYIYIYILYIYCIYTAGQKFGVINFVVCFFPCFWNKSLMLIVAAFIWYKNIVILWNI